MTLIKWTPVNSIVSDFDLMLEKIFNDGWNNNNIQKNKFKHVYLPSQFSGLDPPEIELINLQNEKLEKNKWISSKIFKQINICVEKGEQVLLFLLFP